MIKTSWLLGVALMGGSQVFAQVREPEFSKWVSRDPAATRTAEVHQFLKKLASDYPTTAKLEVVGQSDSGTPILGLALGHGPTHDVVVASHHGNEYGSVEMARALAGSLAENPLDGRTVHVIPVLNLGGYDQKNRYEKAGSESFDPNRNYPGPCGTEGPFTLKSTQSLAQFIDRLNVVSSFTLHTYFPAVVYPWGISTRDLVTPDEPFYQKWATSAALESHYEVGNSTEVIYPADGAYEDYAYWRHGIWSLLFELGSTHTPSRDQVLEMVKVNLPGMRRALLEAPIHRATKHAFTGKCDARLKVLDRHDE